MFNSCVTVTKYRSHDHLTSSSTKSLNWWYFVRRHFFHVFSGNICCFYYNCHDHFSLKQVSCW